MPQNIIRASGNSSSGGGGGTAMSGSVESGAMSLERLKGMLNIPPTSRPPDWTNPLEKIEQLLTCAICLDRYKNPKLLPCQHSFCMDPCLDGLVDIVRRSVRCPECRAEHPLPYDGVKVFQTNYTLMGFLEIHLQATEENATELESYIKRYNMERCKVCDEKSEVDYCLHCEKRICLECKATHVDMMKRDLGRLMNQVKRLCARITDTADTLSRGAESLVVNCENAKEEIRDYVRRYVKELKKREDTLIGEVDAFFNGETRMIKTVRDNLDLESTNINEACARVEACLKGDREMTDEDLVRYKQMFTDGLEYLRTVNPDADDLTNKKIRFVVNDAHLLPHAITQFGELQVCTPQYNHKLAQAEQIYVPRFLQLGMESDNYTTKRRCWDPNDSNTWQQQQPQPAGVKQPVQSSRQLDEDAYSYRYRKRQQLEEQAWNRIRGEHPSQQRQQTHSPKRTAAVQEETQVNARPSSNQFDNSPWSRMQRMNETAPSTADVQTVTNTPPVAQPEPAPSTALPPLPNSVGGIRKSQLHAQSPPKSAFRKKLALEQQQQQQQPAHANSSEEARASTQQQPPVESPTPKPPPRQQKTAIPVPINSNPHAEKGANDSLRVSASASAIATVNSNGQQQQKGRGPSEDRELDQRVANIRKEFEERQNEQQKTILQIQQRVRAHRMPVDVSSIATASSEEEEEEEDQESEDKDGESIPVHVYPSPARTEEKPERAENGEASTERPLYVNTSDSSTSSGTQRKISYPFTKSTQQQPPTGTIDWKKYLIPSPPESGSKAKSSSTTASASGSTSAANETVQKNAESTSTGIPRLTDSRSFNTDESSWNERRRRFVRSKTNPDFSVDLSQLTSSTQPPATPTTPTESTPRISRFLQDNGDPERRRRFGFRGDSVGIQDSNTSNAGSSSGRDEQRSSPAKSRYRRKTERSHSGYAVGPNEENGSGGEPQRFEISISSNNDTSTPAAGPGARFYRVFTNPKIDYLSKGRCVLKFGCKGNADCQFNWPRGIATVPTTEETVVCDSSNHRLQIFDKRGRFLKSLGSYGSNKAEFDCLAGVCINKYRQYVVTDRYNHRVQIFDSTGRHLREFGAHGQTNGRFNSPWGVAVDQQGFIYVCDKDNHRVQIFQADGNFVGKFGGIGNREGQFQNPHFVACNPKQQIVVSDSSNHRIQVFDHNGHFLFTFGSEGFHDGQFKYPRGVAVDDQGFIVVADSGNNRIQVFYPDGRFYSTFGCWGSNDGQLKGVEGVAILNDKIIVSDRENHRIQIF